jgi:hypothetical protein
MSPEEIITPVADLLLEEHPAEIKESCRLLLNQLGAEVPLEGIGSSNWWSELSSKIPDFDKISEVMGDRFFAYAIVLGVQIKGLLIDPRFSANSSVEFSLGDQEVQTLSLGEFRVRVVQSLLVDQPVVVKPSLPFPPADAVTMLAGRNLLVAPLFDIKLKSCILASMDPSKLRAVVGYVVEDELIYQGIGAFNEMIKDKVRQDLAGTAKEPFKIDLNAVTEAKTAFEKGDLDTVISALQTWPGMLSLLQRTPMAGELNEEQRTTIGDGLTLLGTAFQKKGNLNWAEEIFKLGLQFTREGPIAGHLFMELGLIMEGQDRYSESIALFRRALALGIPEARVLTHLGRAFMKTGHVVPAVALFQYAVSSGYEDPQISADLKDALTILGQAGQTWEVPGLTAPGGDEETDREEDSTEQEEPEESEDSEAGD